MRIVSLVPSATEILFALGVGEQVIGVTSMCDYPPGAQSRRVVSEPVLGADLTPTQIAQAVTQAAGTGSGLYQLDRDALRELDADLVLTQDLCGVCAVHVRTVDAALDYLGARASVLTTSPWSVDQVLADILLIGGAVGRDLAAARLVASLQERIGIVVRTVSGRPRPGVVVLEWPDPLFAAGAWVPGMVQLAGGTSLLGTAEGPSAPTSWAEVAAAEPEVIINAPCGYRLAQSEQVAADLINQTEFPRGIPVWAVDSNSAFARPGPRLIDGIEALAGIFHPDCVPGPSPLLASHVHSQQRPRKDTVLV